MKVSYYKNISQVSTAPSIVSAESVLQAIMDGNFKDDIIKLRSSDDKGAVKKKLPCVVFSGVMDNPVNKVSRKNVSYISYRDDKSLSAHSGLAVIDLDHVADLKGTKDKLCSMSEVYSVFVSPSGDGLKVLFRIPANIKKHRGYYRAILKDLSDMGLPDIDSTSINESRLCFVSWDEDLYLNEYADMYTSYIEEAPSIVVIDNELDMSAVATDYKKLDVAAKMIDACKDGEKHRTLIKAAYLMGGYISSGKVRESDAISMLVSRISMRNVSDMSQAEATIRDGVEKGKMKPIYEIEDIESEFKTSLSRSEFEDEQRGYSFLVDSNDVDAKMMSYIRDGVPEGYSTGSPSLDLHFVFKKNTFNMMLGHDNVGKSMMSWFLATCASALHGWKWIIFSPENKIYRIKKTLIDFVLGKSSADADPDKFNKAKSFVDEHFLFMRKDKEYNIFELLEYAELMCTSDKDIKGLLIDPYNSISLDYRNRGKGLSSYEYHLKAATHLRIFAEKNCSVYVSAHSVTGSRRQNLDADGILMRPRKDDTEGGGLWANRADDFMVIHRKVKSEDSWMFTEIHMDKVKDVESGGRVTYDEPVRFQLMFNCDFVDMNGISPLAEWRADFFHGKQVSLDIPLMEPKDDIF